MKIFYKLFFFFTVASGFAGLNAASAQSLEQQRVFNTSGDKKIVAYPIPANNFVSFKLSPGLKAETRTVDLVSVIGRTVATQRVNAGDNDDIIFNNLAQLPEGVYIGVAKNADGKILQTTKLIIQR